MSEFIKVLLSVRLRGHNVRQAVASVPIREHCWPVAASHQRVDTGETVTLQNDGLVSPFIGGLTESAGDLGFGRE
jgi:hypothetical protein